MIGYERVFELERFNQEVESSKNSYGKEPRSVEEEKTKSDSKSSLVKLATKIGTLNSELDRKAEAESWLLKAVELCGDGIGESSSMTTFSKEALKLKEIKFCQRQNLIRVRVGYLGLPVPIPIPTPSQPQPTL